MQRKDRRLGTYTIFMPDIQANMGSNQTTSQQHLQHKPPWKHHKIFSSTTRRSKKTKIEEEDKMDAATLIALTISNNHARYFSQDRKSLITSNEQIIKLVNANVMKLTMIKQKTKLKRIDHRNMPKNLTNL